MGKVKSIEVSPEIFQNNTELKYSSTLISFYSQTISDPNTDPFVKYELVELLKTFIGTSKINELWRIPHKLQLEQSIKTKIEAVCFADIIVFTNVNLSSICSEIKKDLPRSDLEGELPNLEDEKICEGFIERIKYSFNNNYPGGNFKARWEKIENKIPVDVLDKIKLEVPEIGGATLPVIKVELEHLARLEVELFHHIHGISPTPIFDILTQTNLNVWKHSPFKTKTIEFYKILYESFPQILTVLSKIENREKIDISEDEAKAFKNTVINNAGYYFTKVDEQGVLTYMIINSKVEELVEEFINTFNVGQEGARSIFYTFQKLNRPIIDAFQELKSNLIEMKANIRNSFSELKINTDSSASIGEEDDVKISGVTQDGSLEINKAESYCYTNRAYEWHD